MDKIVLGLQDLPLGNNSTPFPEPEVPQIPDTLVADPDLRHGVIAGAAADANFRILVQFPLILYGQHFYVVDVVGLAGRARQDLGQVLGH